MKAIGYFPNTETTYALMDSGDQAMLSLYGCTTISGIRKGVTEFPSPRLMTAPALLSFPMTLIWRVSTCQIGCSLQPHGLTRTLHQF